MSAQGAFKITEEFERLLCEYTGAPYAVAVDNCSNALFLALVHERVRDRVVELPRRTYPSVPCEVRHAGGHVAWREPAGDQYTTGPYQLGDTRVWDCALRFTAGMYQAGQLQCLSFTGPYKHLKLGKGGAILTDDPNAAAWFKRARFSGRGECSYHDDHFYMLGWNFYLMPEVAARGVLLMTQFMAGAEKVQTKDLSLRFPDLSQFPIYTTRPATPAPTPTAHVGCQSGQLQLELAHTHVEEELRHGLDWHDPDFVPWGADGSLGGSRL